MTNEQLLSRIDELERQYDDIKFNRVIVQECEVWARIVGYFRPVKDWNVGKQEEKKDRKMFEL